MYQNFLAASNFTSTGQKAFRLYEVLMEHEHCHVMELLADHFPEHREDEATDLDPNHPVDPAFDLRPDSFEPAPPHLSTRQRIDFEDLRLKGGRVIGRHEVVTDLPYFLTAQFISRKLGCTVAQGQALSRLWQALDATESMVLAFVEQFQSADAAIQYFRSLVEQLPTIDPDDALEHRSEDVTCLGSDLTPEKALLALETIPSAAMLAHRLHISLARAGEIREEMLRFVADPQVCVQDDPEAEVEAEDDEEGDADLRAYLAEGWHLMDDVDERDPDSWLQSQPAHIQVTIAKVRRATTLAELGRLGQKLYAEPGRWTKTQASAFWAEYSAQKQHIQHDLLRRHARLRRAVEKLRTLRGTELAVAGKKLFLLQKENPAFYPQDGWTILWGEYKSVKAKA
jgi:hypothetical protein